ncbi:hypothetical protein M8J77_001814 [Diaphorina citri]|nr:hypothetical protein M8J77_001814 [Diaphorina citri]
MSKFKLVINLWRTFDRYRPKFLLNFSLVPAHLPRLNVSAPFLSEFNLCFDQSPSKLKSVQLSELKFRRSKVHRANHYTAGVGKTNKMQTLPTHIFNGGLVSGYTRKEYIRDVEPDMGCQNYMELKRPAQDRNERRRTKMLLPTNRQIVT